MAVGMVGDSLFRLARWLWALIFLLALLLFFALGVAPLALRQEFAPEDQAALGPLFTPEAALRVDRALDLLTVAALLLTGLISFGVALLLYWRRPNDRMALVVAFCILFLGPFLSADWINTLAGVNPVWGAWGWRLYAPLLEGLFLLLFVLFPDGRFAPGWTRWLLWGYPLWFLAAVSVPVFGVHGNQAPPLALVWYLTPALLALFGQMLRYRLVSSPVQRQQTKLFLISVLVWIVGVILISLPWEAWVSTPTALLLVWAAKRGGWYLGLLVIPLALGIAILRYRLYDLDLIIRKTLQYAVLTALLALVYFGLIVLLQSLLDRATGEQSPIVIVLSTLAIAALFTPLRRRVQDAIDRRFFRRKYDAQQVLAHFALIARDETDLDRLSGELARVVEETMQPAGSSIWLKQRDLP